MEKPTPKPQQKLSKKANRLLSIFAIIVIFGAYKLATYDPDLKQHEKHITQLISKKYDSNIKRVKGWKPKNIKDGSLIFVSVTYESTVNGKYTRPMNIVNHFAYYDDRYYSMCSRSINMFQEFYRELYPMDINQDQLDKYYLNGGSKPSVKVRQL